MNQKIEHLLPIHPGPRDRGSNPLGGKNYIIVICIFIVSHDSRLVGETEINEKTIARARFKPGSVKIRRLRRARSNHYTMTPFVLFDLTIVLILLLGQQVHKREVELNQEF